MLIAVEGIYENGQIILKEKPMGVTRAEVIVIFRVEVSEKNEDPDRKIELGTGQNLGSISDTRFDEDLER